MTEAVHTTEPFTVRDAEAFDITARSGEQYRISVGLPVSYSRTSRSYPVMYVLDADFLFCTMLEQTRLRGMTGEIAEVLVIGLGYPLSDDIMRVGARRSYDGSITSTWDIEAPGARDAHAVFAAMGQPLRLGGAPAFLEFIVDEVQPLIAERYRVDTTDQALYGDSTNGNFAAYALFTRPEAFAKYVIASPGFSYNDFEIFRIEEEYAKNHSDLPAAVYIAAGSPEITQLANGHLVSSTVRMAETLHLRRYPNLRLTTEIISDKTHFPAAVDIMNRGLDFCWPGVTYEVTGRRVDELMAELNAAR